MPGCVCAFACVLCEMSCIVMEMDTTNTSTNTSCRNECTAIKINGYEIDH